MSIKETTHRLQNEHYERFCQFTKLLIILSVASLTVLTSAFSKTIPVSGLLQWSLTLQFLSLCFGILVQRRTMMRPLEECRELVKYDQLAPGPLDGIYCNIEVWKAGVLYWLQSGTFSLSYLLLILYPML